MLARSLSFAYNQPMRFNHVAAAELVARSGYDSRAAFAEAVDISPGTLSDILAEEPRRHPSDALIRRIAAELRVPLAAITHEPGAA